MTEAEVRVVLKEWRANAARANLAHILAQKSWRKGHLWIGIPVVVLSGLVGTSVFAALDQANLYLRIATSFCSVSAAILAALQTFLDPPTRAQMHHQSSAGYAAAKRRIEQFAALDLPPAPELKSELDSIREQLDKLAADAPVVADRHWVRADEQLARIQTSRQNAP